jgi:hypothetical protein
MRPSSVGEDGPVRRTALGCSLALVLALVLAATPAGATSPPRTVATPTVEGPLPGGTDAIKLVTSSYELLAPFGYVAHEYYLRGDATRYAPARRLGENGRWQLRPAGTAPYETRLVVIRPRDPDAFHGTVYVEWLNTTAGFDTSAVFNLVHDELMRSGAAWVGVSAQAGGVQGSDTLLPGATPGGVRGSDPVRYGALHHPGDAYSYDIFSQAGLAAAGKVHGVAPLGGLKAQRVVAIGKSQSAFRLVTYVDGVQPLTHVYDGFLLESRHASGAPLGASSAFSLPDHTVPPRAIIRADSDVPVFVVQTETDVSLFESANARQPDTRRFRLWEVAGTAHADTYTGQIGLNDAGTGAAELAVLDPTNLTGGPLDCRKPVNAGPAFAVLSAALTHLDRWVRDGTLPPTARRIATTGSSPPDITRDPQGNAIGGVRTPLVDVPVATLTGEANEGGSFCDLFGTTTPLDAATLARLYRSHADYVRRFDRSADATARAGFWPETSSERFKAAARRLAVP